MNGCKHAVRACMHVWELHIVRYIWTHVDVSIIFCTDGNLYLCVHYCFVWIVQHAGALKMFHSSFLYSYSVLCDAVLV